MVVVQEAVEAATAAEEVTAGKRGVGAEWEVAATAMVTILVAYCVALGMRVKMGVKMGMEL